MANLDRAVLFKQIDRLYRDGTFTAQSDGQLLDRYLSYRDEGAFEAIVNLHGPMVFSLCRRFLQDPRDIEDAFQATFLILARKAGSIRQREVLSSWLYGVAYRIAVRARSELLRRRSVETGVPLLDDLADFASRDVDEIGPVLDQELSRLPEKYRAPIVLCYLKEQTHDQAAAELRWPVGTVRSRLARGRELLKQRLTRRGCSPATAMLGVGPGFSIRSFTASVPRPLVQATVGAAGRYLWGASSGVGPAALAVSMTSSASLSGSATALAQGVLTTMAFTQIKVISAGLTVAGLLAGGLGAGAWALGSPGTAAQDATPAPAQKTADKAVAKPHSSDPLRAATADFATARTTTGVEARLADLERKLDILLQRVNQPQLGNIAVPPPPTPVPSPSAPPPTPVPSPSAVEANPPVRETSPFVTHGGNQLEPLPPADGKHADDPGLVTHGGNQLELLPQARPQPPPAPDSYAGSALAPQPPSTVQPPPPPAVADSPFEQDRPQLAQLPVLPTPSAEVPPPPAARVPDEARLSASPVDPTAPSVEVANYSQAARTRRDPFEAPAPSAPRSRRSRPRFRSRGIILSEARLSMLRPRSAKSSTKRPLTRSGSSLPASKGWTTILPMTLSD